MAEKWGPRRRRRRRRRFFAEGVVLVATLRELRDRNRPDTGVTLDAGKFLDSKIFEDLTILEKPIEAFRYLSLVSSFSFILSFFFIYFNRIRLKFEEKK